MSKEKSLSELMDRMARRLEQASVASASMIGEPAGISVEYPGEISYSEMPGQKRAGLTFCEQVAVLVWDNLARLEERYRGGGRTLEELGSPDEVAERMVATVPTPSPWNETLGAFYGPGKIARVLGGVSRQAVADRRGRGTLLGLKTADGKWVYPAFQFDDRHQILEGLSEIVRCLRAAELDDWTLASWLVTERPELEGSSTAAWLRQGRSADRPLALAREAVSRLLQ